jgi:hypothetical protein
VDHTTFTRALRLVDYERQKYFSTLLRVEAICQHLLSNPAPRYTRGRTVSKGYCDGCNGSCLSAVLAALEGEQCQGGGGGVEAHVYDDLQFASHEPDLPLDPYLYYIPGQQEGEYKAQVPPDCDDSMAAN